MSHYLDRLLLCSIRSAFIRVKAKIYATGAQHRHDCHCTCIKSIFFFYFAVIHETSRTAGFKTNTLYAFVLSSTHWFPVHIEVTLQNYVQAKPATNFWPLHLLYFTDIL